MSSASPQRCGHQPVTCHHPPCAYHMVNCERTICYSLQKLFYYLFLESEKQLIHSHALDAYALL